MHTCPECGDNCECDDELDNMDFGDFDPETDCTCCEPGEGDSEEDDLDLDDETDYDDDEEN